MSDTCIVCLGDLSKGNSEAFAPSDALAKSPRQDVDGLSTSTDAFPAPSIILNNNAEDSTLIAHLQPCGHDLHNECLKPWVERANSCPVCRRTFNLVDLSNTVGGPIISSYTVEDRTQVAELDPSMFLEVPDEEEEETICQECGEDDNEDVLMYCDSCEKLWHTYCVDLQEVPFGHWFCENCRSQREVDPRQTRASRPSRRRTRAQQRRHRSDQQQAHDSGWTQVWQSVWNRINIDLDFPNDDDEDTAKHLRRLHSRNQANRQAHEAWRRRMQVAELHGAGRRFGETEHAILDSQPSSHAQVRRPSPKVDAQTADEMLAWNAFDQARANTDTESGTTRKRKRKSRTSSPAEPDIEPASSTIKRRRVSVPNVRSSSTPSAGSSRRTRNSPHTSPLARAPVVASDMGPSFLASLLQEVEDSSTSSRNIPLYRPLPRNAASPPAEQHSPRPSSPALSPPPSNHSSPRAMSATPPPLALARPSSPTGLSSSIQPVFPSTEYSPSRSSPEPRDSSPDPSHFELNRYKSRIPPALVQPPKSKSRVPRVPDQSNTSSRPRSHDTSPTRATLSLSAKADVQKLVSAALKPHYNDQVISKDEYTTINRDISRALYDKIGNLEALDIDGKAKWEKVAGDEVNKAISTLKGQTVSVISS